MHEYAIVASLIERVQEEAERRGAVRVDRLHVRIGAVAGVEIELLKTAYDTFRDRTICRGAELEIESVAAVWACPRCGAEVRAGGGWLRCPHCDAPAELRQGDEIVLQRIEMEVPRV